MYYEVTSRRVTIDKRGDDKSVTENFLVTHAALFSEAETAILHQVLDGERRCSHQAKQHQ